MQMAINSDDKEQIFRFWDLPLELRDEIYDLSSERVLIKCDDHFQVHAIDVPALSLLLVSKKFKTEYAARMEKKVSQLLVAADYSDSELETPNKIALPRSVLAMNIIHINLTLSFSCHLQSHYSWVCNLANAFGSGCTLSICVDAPVYIQYTDGPLHDRLYLLELTYQLYDSQYSLRRIWFELKNLAEIRIYDCSSREACSNTEIRPLGDRDRLMMEWTATEKVLKQYAESH